ncbi:flagellar hook-basal body protein [Schlesneria paludicola]|uniref:flagellar hook-basal body protein n=1 Tax=Schlesneria paludicola TaxID=360056 RepID=UPI00029A14F7|nr:flagellar hook-basal body complex protein [Schlesneria paludicola]
MLTSLFTASTALDAYQTSLNNTSNNLANINTTAFKASGINFQDLFSSGPNGNQIGNGISVAEISPKGFEQGQTVPTQRDNDLAINGRGFFQVQLQDGQIQYTRDGSFHRDATGRLVTNEGYIVQPPITIPSNTLSTTVAIDGTVSIITSTSAGVPKVIGQIQLAQFANQEGLRIEPGNLYSQTPNSGPPTTGTPGTLGLGRIQQFALEQSNVDVTTELAKMVTTQQAFSANSKVVNASSQMITSTLSLIQ